MLIKKSFINGKIIFGNGEVILPLKNIDRVSVSIKSAFGPPINHISIYWSKSKKIEAPKILYTNKKGDFSKPIYITTHGGIFKIGKVVSTQFQYILKYIIGTEIVFSGAYTNSELENLETKINTILFLISPMLITTNTFSNVTEEIPL